MVGSEVSISILPVTPKVACTDDSETDNLLICCKLIVEIKTAHVNVVS